MVDPWRTWDARVKTTGRPERAAQEATDAELVSLLRSHEQEERTADLRIVADELERRLLRARTLGPQEPIVDETRARIQETVPEPARPENARGDVGPPGLP